MQFVHVLDRGYSVDNAKLRIASANAARFHHSRTPRAGEHSRSAEALQFCDAAGMIEVDVRIQNEFHVFDSKS